MIDTRGTLTFPTKFLVLLQLVKELCSLLMLLKGSGTNHFKPLFGYSHDLEIIPVLNKMDMPSAMPEGERSIVDLLGCDRDDILRRAANRGRCRRF